MKKVLLTLAVATLTLAFAVPTQASPKTGSSSKSVSSKKITSGKVTITKSVTSKLPTNIAKINPSKAANYHLQQGTKFAQGYLYKGKHHTHWGSIRFDNRYGCDCYWDPCVLVWYYWCERDICYYPVSFCPYRCYSCEAVIVERSCEVCRPVTCQTCTTVRPDGIPASTEAQPLNDIPPIPEPVNPRP